MFSIYEYQPPFRKAKCLDDASGSTYGGRYAEYDTTGLGGGDLSGSEYKKIVLYMPEDIRMDQGVSWSGQEVGNVQMAAMRAISAGLEGKKFSAALETAKQEGSNAGWNNLMKTLSSKIFRGGKDEVINLFKGYFWMLGCARILWLGNG